MAESDHDELADALARMGQEDVAPSERPPTSPPPSRPVARPAPARVPAPAPKPARPPAPVLGTPSPAAAPRPAVPSAAPRPVAPAAPSPSAARKARPTAPTIRQATSAAPTDAEADSGQSTGLSASADNTEVIDDDDSVIVPAPDVSAFIPKAKPTSSAEFRAALARKRNLNFRRTLIPILLTSGTMLLAFGCLKSFSGPDSMFANLAGWIPVVLFGFGGVLFLLAILNMVSVKVQLDSQKK